jgi:transcriptional regulator with XRE-family HTH domain
MAKSVFTDAYAVFLETLIAARKRAGVTQAELAARLGKPQPFVSNIERAERRVDLIEFYAIARALGLDPVALFKQIVRKLPKDVAV